MIAAGNEATVFTGSGPAGLFALFPQAEQIDNLRWAFVNEWMCNMIMTMLVFAVIDPSNFFSEVVLAPWILGAGYSAVIWGFASQSLALNAARAVGGQFACAAVYGTKCFTTYPGYSALSALTTFPGTLVGAMLYTLFLGDTDRVLVNLPPAVKTELGLDLSPQSLRALTRDTLVTGDLTPEKDERTHIETVRRRNPIGGREEATATQ